MGPDGTGNQARVRPYGIGSKARVETDGTGHTSFTWWPQQQIRIQPSFDCELK